MALRIKKKPLLSILILIVLFIVTAAMLKNFVKMDSVEAVSDSSLKISLFSARFFNISINGIINEKSLFKYKILQFSKDKLPGLVEIRSNNDNYLLTFDEGKISFFTIEGSKLNSVELEAERIISSCISDLDNDTKSKLIILTSKNKGDYADEMIVYNFIENIQSKKSISIEEIYRFSCDDLNPWKVQTCDVDGDGKHEISLGVYKTAPFHPEMAKRPFIYDWHKNGIAPKWRGSRLSRPFEDYIFSDIDLCGSDELISIEYLPDGSKALASYKWKGFGFERNAESESFSDIQDLRRGSMTEGQGFEIEALVKGEKDIKLETFVFKDGILKVKKD